MTSFVSLRIASCVTLRPSWRVPASIHESPAGSASSLAVAVEFGGDVGATVAGAEEESPGLTAGESIAAGGVERLVAAGVSADGTPDAAHPVTRRTAPRIVNSRPICITSWTQR
jgi:hypothetical protein